MKKFCTILITFLSVSFAECSNKPTHRPIQQEFYRQRWTQDYLEKSQFAGIKTGEDGRKYIPFNTKVYWGSKDSKETMNISFLKKVIKENFMKLALFGKDTSMTPIYFVALKMAASNGGTSYQTVNGLNHFNISYEFMKKNMMEDSSLLKRYKVQITPEEESFYVFDSEVEAKIIMGIIYHNLKNLQNDGNGEAMLNGTFCQMSIENFPKRLEFYTKIARQVWKEFEDDNNDDEDIVVIASPTKPKKEVSVKKQITANTNERLEEGIELAKKYADGLHGRIPPSVFLTLWTQETSQGRKGVGAAYHNNFNIKCWKHIKMAKRNNNRNIETNGCCVNIHDNSKWDHFRIYSNMDESFSAFSVFLRINRRYRKAFRETEGEDFLKAIAKAGYATDEKYQEHILNVMEDHGFKKYDKEESFLGKLLAKKQD